jgi:hypothetical protein
VSEKEREEREGRWESSKDDNTPPPLLPLALDTTLAQTCGLFASWGSRAKVDFNRKAGNRKVVFFLSSREGGWNAENALFRFENSASHCATIRTAVCSSCASR